MQFAQQIRTHHRSVGFSLIEILVVVVIIGVLVAAVAPNFIGKGDKAKVTVAKKDLSVIDTALEMYKLDNHRFPTTDQSLDALMRKPSSAPEPKSWQGPYLKKTPKDPWGGKYQYLSPGNEGRAYEVYSLGADGKEGGEEFDADVSNWDE